MPGTMDVDKTWPPRCPRCKGKLVHSMTYDRDQVYHRTRCTGVFQGRPCTFEREVLFARIDIVPE